MAFNLTLRCNIDTINSLNAQLAHGVRITITVNSRSYTCKYTGFYVDPIGHSSLYDLDFNDIRLIKDGVLVDPDILNYCDMVELRMHNGTRRKILEAIKNILLTGEISK